MLMIEALSLRAYLSFGPPPPLIALESGGSLSNGSLAKCKVEGRHHQVDEPVGMCT